MLIGTLPTLVGDSSFASIKTMIAHPLIGAVRYNTGGDSPHAPADILAEIKRQTDFYGKKFYVDLEGRQTRVARWVPSDQKTLVINRDFDITPPAKVYVRNAGWFDLVAANPAERKIYLDGGPDLGAYYFGEGQSVHIIGGNFAVKGYLGGRDFEYIEVARELGINWFMLSFFEEAADRKQFYSFFPKRNRPQVGLKIESQRGIDFARRGRLLIDERLVAARDDLFLSFGPRPDGIMPVLKEIVRIDSNAILTSKLLQGLQQTGNVTLGDMADLLLMKQFGYKHFMLSDGIAAGFESAIRIWQELSEMTKTMEVK